MALVSIRHFEGMGDHYLQRVIGFKPNDPDAVEYATEQLAQHIGTLRGGDGYGYPLNYGEGDGWTDLSVHWLDEGRYLIIQDWRPLRPTAPMRSDGGFEHDGRRYTKVIDANDRRWTYDPDGYWTCESDENDPEYWEVSLCDKANQYDRSLIRRARHDANVPEGSKPWAYRGDWNPDIVE